MLSPWARCDDLQGSGQRRGPRPGLRGCQWLERQRRLRSSEPETPRRRSLSWENQRESKDPPYLHAPVGLCPRDPPVFRTETQGRPTPLHLLPRARVRDCPLSLAPVVWARLVQGANMLSSRSVLGLRVNSQQGQPGTVPALAELPARQGHRHADGDRERKWRRYRCCSCGPGSFGPSGAAGLRLDLLSEKWNEVPGLSNVPEGVTEWLCE